MHKNDRFINLTSFRTDMSYLNGITFRSVICGKNLVKNMIIYFSLFRNIFAPLNGSTLGPILLGFPNFDF